MPQPYNIPMPNVVESYNRGVDRARTNLDYAREQETLRQEQIKNALIADAYRRNYDPGTGRVNTNALMGELAKAGYGADIPKYMQTYGDLEKTRIANFADELKNQKDLLSGVSDQASWDAWSANAASRLGPELARFIPPTYSEEAKRKLMLDADKQYEQVYRDFDLGGTRFVLGSPKYGGPSAEPVFGGQVTMTPYEEGRLAIERRQAAERPGPTLQKGGAVLLEDGAVVNTIFDPASGTFFYETPQGRRPVPPSARPATASVGAPLTGQQLITRRSELADEVKGIRALDSYFNTVDNIDQGVGFIADKLVANAKTLFDSELSEKQLATLDSNSQLQRLLGLLRESVVGPGVMTEYDAQRVIMALGGNYGGLRNKQLVKKIIGDLIADKRRRAETMQRELADSERVFGLSPIELPELEEETESTDLGKLSDEELLRRLGR